LQTATRHLPYFTVGQCAVQSAAFLPLPAPLSRRLSVGALFRPLKASDRSATAAVGAPRNQGPSFAPRANAPTGRMVVPEVQRRRTPTHAIHCVTSLFASVLFVIRVMATRPRAPAFHLVDRPRDPNTKWNPRGATKSNAFSAPSRRLIIYKDGWPAGLANRIEYQKLHKPFTNRATCGLALAC